LLEIPKNFYILNNIIGKIELGVEIKEGTGAECKKCKQRK